LHAADDRVNLLVHRDLEHIILPEDRTYIESVLADFRERIRIDAVGLFQQLCSLATGPLLTREVGDFPTDPSPIHQIQSEFSLL
jgi:hypothetical protein